GLPGQRRRCRRRPGCHDPGHERAGHLAALPRPATHQMVTTMTQPSVEQSKAEERNLSFYYGDFRAIKDVSLNIAKNEVTALIGPSGCGKSTLLRCFNRMHDLYPGSRYEGAIQLNPE